METQVARPQFNDSTLRKALDEVGPVIESFTERLDKLSSDIKQLEGFFERSGVRIHVEVSLGNSSEFLVWEKGEPDRWRIMYRRDSQSFDDETHCPLIEAPVDIRLRARKRLPELLKQVAAAASTDDYSTTTADDTAGGGPPPGDDEIPF
jgi:hypothetical protein